jgi:hypothetical protein
VGLGPLILRYIIKTCSSETDRDLVCQDLREPNPLNQGFVCVYALHYPLFLFGPGQLPSVRLVLAADLLSIVIGTYPRQEKIKTSATSSPHLVATECTLCPCVSDRIRPELTETVHFRHFASYLATCLAWLSHLFLSLPFRRRNERVYVKGGPLGRVYTAREARDRFLWDGLEGFPQCHQGDCRHQDDR